MTMPEAYILIRGMQLGVLLIIALNALRNWQAYESKLLLVLVVSVAGYVLAPLVYGSYVQFRIAVAFADFSPLAFLLFAQGVFADHKKPAMLSIGLGVVYYLCGYMDHILALSWITIANEESIGMVFNYISRVFILSILALAMFVILSNWRSDLVETRRTLRLQMSTVLGFYIAFVVIAETVNDWDKFPLWIDLLHSISMLAVSVWFFRAITLVGPSNLTIVRQQPEQSTEKTVSPIDKKELALLLTAMEEAHSYRNMELTISSLADEIAVPEHHLRSLINRHLGYRNFNDFLNQYRVAEAADKLADEQHANLPIMTIAMDAGYRSMTTFNKAFKAITGKTPREFRLNSSEN